MCLQGPCVRKKTINIKKLAQLTTGKTLPDIFHKYQYSIFRHASSMALWMTMLTEILQQLLDELQKNTVQTFIIPRGQILLTLGDPLVDFCAVWSEFSYVF